MKIKSFVFAVCLTLTATAWGQSPQWVEGFSQVEFHHHEPRYPVVRDFRGLAHGYMTAGWYNPEQMKNNVLSWKTAAVPAKRATTFAFIGSSAVLPSEFSRGPQVRLTVNGRPALTFTIGMTRDITWKEGEFELKYISKRVEYPYYAGSHRQHQLHGNSGIYQLTVPASAVEAGQPALLKVELLPFAGWNNGWFMVKARTDVLQQSMEILEGEIEALRQDMAAVTQLTQVLATKLYPELVDTRAFEHRVVYTNGYRHVHPADLIKLQNGELLIMAREATEHNANDGDVVMLRSKDGGLTWGERQVIAGIPKLDEREGCGVQLKDGTIIVGIFYNALYRADDSYMSDRERQAKLDDPTQRLLGTYMITSKDNGHTWSEPHYLDTTGMPYSSVEGPTDAPIEMPDGSVVMAIIGYSPNGDEGNRSSVLIRSTDQGKTWKHVSIIASDVGNKLGGFMEPGIVRTKTGRLVVGLRNHGPDHPIYMTYSDDDGKTWAPVKRTEMIGHPVDLIQLSDGRLMATYGIRPGRHTSPGGVRACFSSDNGETWDIQTEVQIRKDFLNTDVGYPESLEMPDGRVLTVYYYNLFRKFYLGSSIWKP